MSRCQEAFQVECRGRVRPSTLAVQHDPGSAEASRTIPFDTCDESHVWGELRLFRNRPVVLRGTRFSSRSSPSARAGSARTLELLLARVESRS